MSVAFACALLLCADPLAVKLQREADKATVRVEADRVVIAIESASGIGSATLSPGEQGWPKQVRLELRLKGLEGFSMTRGDLRVQTSLGDTMPEVLRREGEQWKPVDLDLEVAPAIEKKDGRILVDIPSAWLEGKSITVQWIDYYRG